MNQLGKRLELVKNMIPKDSKVIDVGTDHAFLPIYLYFNEITKNIIASDNKKGPVNIAYNNLKNLNLEKKIDLRLGDGLQVINSDDEIDVAVIAGMGESLIIKIINESKIKIKNIIVQSNSIFNNSLRKNMIKKGYEIIEEEIVEENNHFYEIMMFTFNEFKKGIELEEKEYNFGPLLLKNQNNIFREKWLSEYSKRKNIFDEQKSGVSNKFSEELNIIKNILD